MCILCQSGDEIEARVERAAQAALDDTEGTAEAETVTEGEAEATAEETPAAGGEPTADEPERE